VGTSVGREANARRSMFHPDVRVPREERAHDWSAITSRNGCGEVRSTRLGLRCTGDAETPTEDHGGETRRAACEAARHHRRSS